MKRSIFILCLLLVSQFTYSEQNNDTINVPYLKDINIMGYTLGDVLSEAIDKSDLIINADYGYQQIFQVVQSPKRSIKKINLFYVKQIGQRNIGGNRLYMIHIEYSNEYTDRTRLIMDFPNGYKRSVLIDKVNEYGIYQYRVEYEFNDTLTDKDYTVQIELADKPDGQLWVDYYIKFVKNKLQELH